MNIGPILIINLESRTDRLKDVKAEMSAQGLPFFRFDAYTGGWRGCLKSHIEALTHIASTIKSGADNDSYGAVGEDDIVWKRPWKDIKNTVRQIQKKYKPDVIMISRTAVDLKPDTIPGASRVVTALSGALYLVKKSYATKLAHYLQDHPHKPLDITWQALQKRDKWYTLTEKAVVQRPGFSDIENKVIDYDYLQ